MPMIGRAAHAALLGRHHGHVDGRLADHRQDADRGLYLNAGWCYGGFKATPASGWCFAHLIARDGPHPAAAAYRLDRFATGACSTRAARARSPICIEIAMRIPCPYCGVRDLREFAPRRSAGPTAGSAAPEAEVKFFDYVYLRDNPAGPQRGVLVSRVGLPLVAKVCATRARMRSKAPSARRGGPR